MMKIKQIHVLTPAYLALLLLTLLLGGCSFVQIVVNSSTESQLLRDGENAFKVGNYKKAENLFERVYSSQTDQQTKNTALYNLACTRIVLAGDLNDVTSAISLFDAWKKSYPSGIYTENPNFVITALQKSQSLILQEVDRVQHAQQKIQKSKLANTKIKNSYKNQKKIVEDLTIQLQSLEAIATEYQLQIETLQHQIRELEEIDQQLQEKKKPL